MTPSALRELARANRDIETKQKAAAFADVCRWLMIGKGNLGNAVHTAQGAGVSDRVIDGIKAAVFGGSTTDPNFAAPLAYQELADGFLVSLRNVGIFDAALPFALDVPLNMQVAITTLGASAATIPEGQTKIISRITLANQALTPRKAVAIVVATTELLRAGGARAAKLFQQELARAVAAETDNKFLSQISTGISGTPSQGSNAVGIAADMAALLAQISIGAGSKVFVAMNPNDAKHMAIQISTIGAQAFPSMQINGGNYAGATVMPTDALSGQIIGFDASQLVMSSTGIELDASNQANIQMDTTPDSPPSASSNYTSMWQLNQTGLRATRWFGCERLRSTAVGVITGVAYGSANSPA